MEPLSLSGETKQTETKQTQNKIDDTTQKTNQFQKIIEPSLTRSGQSSRQKTPFRAVLSAYLRRQECSSFDESEAEETERSGNHFCDALWTFALLMRQGDIEDAGDDS